MPSIWENRVASTLPGGAEGQVGIFELVESKTENLPNHPLERKQPIAYLLDPLAGVVQVERLEDIGRDAVGAEPAIRVPSLRESLHVSRQPATKVSQSSLTPSASTRCP